MTYPSPVWRPEGHAERFDRGNGEGKYRLLITVLFGHDEADALAQIQDLPQVKRIALNVRHGEMAQQDYYAIEVEFDRRGPESRKVVDFIREKVRDMRVDSVLDIWERQS